MARCHQLVAVYDFLVFDTWVLLAPSLGTHSSIRLPLLCACGWSDCQKRRCWPYWDSKLLSHSSTTTSYECQNILQGVPVGRCSLWSLDPPNKLSTTTTGQWSCWSLDQTSLVLPETWSRTLLLDFHRLRFASVHFCFVLMFRFSSAPSTRTKWTWANYLVDRSAWMISSLFMCTAAARKWQWTSRSHR